MSKADPGARKGSQGSVDDVLQFDDPSYNDEKEDGDRMRSGSLPQAVPVITFSQAAQEGFQRLASQPVYLDPSARSYRRY